MLRLAVLVSGQGSLLEAMIQDRLPIAVVIADRPCRGLDIARSADIESLRIERSFKKDEFDVFRRLQFTRDLEEWLVHNNIGLVAMAGFMTVLDKVIFLGRYKDRILNIHPSLLPAFKGESAVEDALTFGVKVTGTTIHYATEKLDDGPIIAQKAVDVDKYDTVKTLHERIKVEERKLYPRIVRDLMHNIPQLLDVEPQAAR